MSASRAVAPRDHAPLSLLRSLRSAWPPGIIADDRGYRPIPLADTRPVDALPLTTQGAPGVLAVARDPQGACALVPCVPDGSGWRLARAGDGLAAALVAQLGALPQGERVVQGRFALERYGSLPASPALERGLLADQSNLSFIVDEIVVCKWRTAFDSSGLRSLLLRRHLAAGGFDETPALLGSLTWAAPDGTSVCLADVDRWLPGAQDGWEHYIDLLTGLMRGQGEASQEARHIGTTLGRLTARLHLGLAAPSALLPEPVGSAADTDVRAWLSQAVADVAAAAALEAPDAEVVADSVPGLRRDIEGIVSAQGGRVQPIHGDLHLGQLVSWAGGLAVIDFDGPPGAPTATMALAPVERDVAQLLCSVDHLAAAVDQRTDGSYAGRLRVWAADAKTDLLEAYRVTTGGAAPELDARALEGFGAQQLCRELLYAAARLPRWRYAPIQALRWRYPQEDHA